MFKEWVTAIFVVGLTVLTVLIAFMRPRREGARKLPIRMFVTLSVLAASIVGVATTASGEPTSVAPAFTSPSSVPGSIGKAFSFDVTTSGSPTPQISGAGLPAWLSIVDEGDGTAQLASPRAKRGMFTFVLAARSSAGSATQSFTLLITHNAKAPRVPRNVKGATSEIGSATVSWTAPSSRGRLPITSYTVQPSPSCSLCGGLSVSGSPPDTQTTVTGLTIGTAYTFEVTATNSVGTGPPSRKSKVVAPLSFDDEFSGTTLSSAWTAVTGANPGNGEQECYSPQNVSVSGGWLHENAAVGSISNCDCPPAPASNDACPYVSGAIQWASSSFTYGTVSVRAKFPGGQGTWPAIWLLGADCQQPTWILVGSSCQWPAPGSNEIDIAEILNSNDTQVNEQIHTEDASGAEQSPGCSPSASDVSENWHTYTLIWAPGSLTWEIDATQTCKITSLVPTTPMFLIINTAVGGCCSGSVQNSTLPQTTEVDYVRVT